MSNLDEPMIPANDAMREIEEHFERKAPELEPCLVCGDPTPTNVPCANPHCMASPEMFDPVEAMIAWDVPHIAAEPEAVKAVLKEYAVRLIFEHGLFGWIEPFSALFKQAGQAATTEYLHSKIIKEGQVDV